MYQYIVLLLFYRCILLNENDRVTVVGLILIRENESLLFAHSGKKPNHGVDGRKYGTECLNNRFSLSILPYAKY